MKSMGWFTDLTRNVRKLEGILLGIASDQQVSLAELKALEDWLRLHDNLADKWPFLEVAQRVRSILDDGLVDEVEEVEFLDFAQGFAENNARMILDHTSEIRVLHGYLEGIAADGSVNLAEARALERWVAGRNVYHGLWPFSELVPLLETVLADGRIDADEHKALMDFCIEFMDVPVEEPVATDRSVITAEPWMRTDAPTVQTVQSICASCPSVVRCQHCRYWLRFFSRRYSRISFATLMTISKATTHFAGLMMNFTICSASPPPDGGICPKTAVHCSYTEIVGRFWGSLERHGTGDGASAN